jgi:hypothetical protein
MPSIIRVWGEIYGEYDGSSNIIDCLECGYFFGQVIGTRNDPQNMRMSLKVDVLILSDA